MKDSENLSIKGNAKTSKKKSFDIRLELLKNVLDRENIKYDSEIEDYKELREYVSRTLTKDEQLKLDNKLRIAQDELLTFAKELRKGTNNTFQNCLEKAGKYIVDTAALSTLIGVTTKFALDYFSIRGSDRISENFINLIGDITKLGLIGVGLYGGKIALDIKRKMNSNSYDRIIKKLETTKNEYGNIVDTRFNESEKLEIERYFNGLGKNIDIEDYDELRAKIKELPNTKKLELINILNAMKGNPINVNEELGKNRKSLIQAVKNWKETGKSILTIAGAGVAGAGIIGIAMKQPILELAKELPIGAAVAGAVIALDYGRRKISKLKEQKREGKIIDAIDAKLYPKENNPKALSENQLLMLEIINRFMEEKGIEIADTEDEAALKDNFQKLQKNDKKELRKILGTMQKQLKKKSFKKDAQIVLKSTQYSVRLSSMQNIIEDAFEVKKLEEATAEK